MSKYDRREYQKPVPPWPEKRQKRQKPDRRRDRRRPPPIPRDLDADTLQPCAEDEYPVRGKALREGIETCFLEQAHVLRRATHSWTYWRFGRDHERHVFLSIVCIRCSASREVRNWIEPIKEEMSRDKQVGHTND